MRIKTSIIILTVVCILCVGNIFAAEKQKEYNEIILPPIKIPKPETVQRQNEADNAKVTTEEQDKAKNLQPSEAKPAEKKDNNNPEAISKKSKKFKAINKKESHIPGENV